jgi:glycine/D-amino acid oxidase-like deaminating enzyme
LWPGLAQSVFPVRSYQMATAPIPQDQREAVLPFDHACSDTQGDLHFFRWDATGRLVTGGALAVGWDWEARQRERIGRRVSAVFPRIGVPVFDYLWFGHVGITLDRKPHVHELAPGVLAWLGCNGRGVGLAGAIGAQFARACLGTPLAELPLPFTPLAPVFGHAVGRHLRGLGILYYRYRDSREVA